MEKLADISLFESLSGNSVGFVVNSTTTKVRPTAKDIVSVELGECEKIIKQLRKLYDDPEQSLDSFGNMYSYSRCLSTLALQLADGIRRLFEEINNA